jgi:DNA (cytosine-5)-methyltransferase 1
MFRIISELRPHWVINENVAGSVSNLVLDQKIADLKSIGYTWGAFNIPAVAVNADHERKRIFLIANSYGERWPQLLCADPGAIFSPVQDAVALGAHGNAFLRFQQSVAEPPLFPVANGLPDNIFRLEAAGNSIVSPIPLILLQAIKAIYELTQ